MERLKELRALKNMTQKEVAEALGVDRTTYAKYETGGSEPSFEILKRIALFYDVSCEYLLDFAPEGKKNKPEKSGLSLSREEMTLIRDFRTLNRQGKEFVKQTLYTAIQSNVYKKDNDRADVEDKIG